MSEAVHIHTRIESETLTQPELRQFVGKSVEITVREEVAAPKKPDVEKLERLAKEIDFRKRPRQRSGSCVGSARYDGGRHDAAGYIHPNNLFPQAQPDH